jgi:hypothetical protein
VSPATVRRTTARVVPINRRGEALPMLSSDPAVNNKRLPAFVRAAVSHLGSSA